MRIFFIYSFKMIFTEFLNNPASQSSHFLLVGNPVGHSISPVMHNTALQYHAIDASYHAVSVSLRDIASLAAHFNSELFMGANITIPHKQTLLEVVDSLTDTAQSIGAINTIVKKDGKLIGENTDAYGFITPLKEFEEEVEPSRAIIFGVGGATKAILYALNQFGFQEVCMVSRNPDRHDEEGAILCSYDSWQEYADEASLIINATPLGMHPNVNASPVRDEEVDYLAGKFCYDIVYNPLETKFLQQAKKVQGIPIGGLDMLLYQGAKSFELWTGKEFPIDVVKSKLNEQF